MSTKPAAGQSSPGEGTTVRMLFPRHVPEPDDAPSDGDAVQSGYRARPLEPGASPLVLVVDDVVEAAAMAAETLRDIGYRTMVAHGAEEALQRFEEAAARGDRVGLLFSDVIMPGGPSGLELAAQVRERAPDVPILLTTGYNDEMAIDGPQVHAMDVLGKPYRRSELIDRVQSALRAGARRGAGRETSEFGHAKA